MFEGILVVLGVILILSPCIHATWFDHRSSNVQNDDNKMEVAGTADEEDKKELYERNDCEVSVGEVLSAIFKSELIVVIIMFLVGVGHMIGTIFFITINDSKKTIDCISVAAACMLTVMLSNKLGLWGSRTVSLSELLQKGKKNNNERK